MDVIQIFDSSNTFFINIWVDPGIYQIPGWINQYHNVTNGGLTLPTIGRKQWACHVLPIAV